MTAQPIPRWQRYSTASIAVLAIVSALLGLLRQGMYQPALLPGFYVQDALILLVGVPALSIGLLAARAGSLRGRILWLGALVYMSYMWATIALQITFNQFFLGYVALFGLAVYTLLGGFRGTDPDEVRDAMADGLSERTYGVFLWGIAIGLAALWLSELVPATLSGTPPLLVEEVGPQALASHFIDLSVVAPGLAIAGTLLWRRHPWGYVFGGVGLVFGAILAPTLTGMTMVIALEGAVTVPLVAIVLTTFPALLALALAVTYLRLITEPGPAVKTVVPGGPTEKVP